MKLQLDKYIYTMRMWDDQIAEFREHPEVQESIPRVGEADLKVYWGHMKPPSGQSVIIETGFFWQAAHIDTVGLYHHSSLCTPEAIRMIERFDAPEPSHTVIFSQKQTSKYHQGQDDTYRKHDLELVDTDWSGKIVLACQNPGDRSIRSVASPNEYYQFIEDACRFYGTDLFIKLHPWNSGEIGDRLRAIAAKYGVLAAKVNHRILKGCMFCLVFNSTFSVDCMLRGIPVAQYAPGYFYQNPAIHYTKFAFPTQIPKIDIEFGFKTCDFLVWKYCFDHSMSGKDWIEMFKRIVGNRNMFPLPEEYSYGHRKMQEIGNGN